MDWTRWQATANIQFLKKRVRENNSVFCRIPTLTDTLVVWYKRGDTKVLGLNSWRMKLLGRGGRL